MSEIGRSGASAPSGHSAKPEPSSTVSAVPASVTNATGLYVLPPEEMGDDELAQELELLKAIERYNTLGRATRRRRRLHAVKAEFDRRFAEVM